MSILIFLAVLVVLILVHELGHFAVAKWFGIRVDEFGIGFPPKVWGKKFGETEYTLNALPIGGFVRIWGEDPTQEHYEDGPESERSFVKKPRYAQALVLVAGVTMNVLLAFVLYTMTFMLGMPTAIDESEVGLSTSETRLLIDGTMPDSPAAGALKHNDEILKLSSGGEALGTNEAIVPSAVIRFVQEHAGRSIVFEVLRSGEKVMVELTPRAGLDPKDPEKELVGMQMQLVGTLASGPFESIKKGAIHTYDSLLLVSSGLAHFFMQAIRGDADLDQVAGPIGMAGMVGEQASRGPTWLLAFAALISLNLAVINLLPIPALDGGRLLFVLVEAITRRPIKPAFAVRANQIGFLALLALMAVVTLSDLFKLFGTS